MRQPDRPARPWDTPTHGQPPQPSDGSATRRAPSSDTTGRLVRAVGGELDRLRSDVADELVLVRLLLNVGQVEAAHRLMDKQSARMRHFQDHVEAAIASAVVERTAEEILAEASEAPDRPDFTPRAAADEAGRGTAVVPAETGAFRGASEPRLRLLVAAASLVVLAAVFATSGPLPALHEFVAGRSNGSSHSTREGARNRGEDRNATAGDVSATESEEASPPSADDTLKDSADAPEILLLLGRLARFAEGSGGAPVSALLDVDRLVARLVTEVAPMLAPMTSEPPQGTAPPASQPAQPDAAAQPQPNSGPQPPVPGEPAANQPQPEGQAPPEPLLVGNPAPPDQGAEGGSLEERWRKQKEQGEPAPPPAPYKSEVKDGLAPRE